MSAPQFSVKRRFINGANDWRYQNPKAPVTTTADQYIYDVKQFADPIKALSDVMCSGFYYGDGTHLTNVTGTDPTKLPLTGGTLTGSLTVDAPGIISGDGSGLTGVTANDPTKLPLAGDTLAGDFTLNTPSGKINLDTVSGGGDINLSAYNLNSFGYALPICFDFYEIDRNYNYTAGGQNWELIWQQDVHVPREFFSESPASGSYTSAKWRINFTINTWSAGGNNSSDKGLAYYITFEDQGGNPYDPYFITPDTPFCRHNNNSTWTGGYSLTEFQPFSWTDLVDFSGLYGTGSSSLPLRFKVYFAADNSKNFNFTYHVGLTKTTRI
jgi:hypothetical protein